jgi:hypothetical protein
MATQAHLVTQRDRQHAQAPCSGDSISSQQAPNTPVQQHPKQQGFALASNGRLPACLPASWLLRFVARLCLLYFLVSPLLCFVIPLLFGLLPACLPEITQETQEAKENKKENHDLESHRGLAEAARKFLRKLGNRNPLTGTGLPGAAQGFCAANHG